MANIYKQGNILDFTAGSDFAPGIIVEHPSGRTGIVLGDGIKNGETGSVQTEILVTIPNPDAVVVAAGADANYDQANDKLLPTGGFVAGKVVYASSGTNDVVVRLGPN